MGDTGSIAGDTAAVTARRDGFPVLARRGPAGADGTAPVLAFAHRGGARHPDLLGLENTRRAFAHAYALGFRWLETDVHVSRDGCLVAFHDPVLERVTDGNGMVESMTMAEIEQLRIGGTEAIPRLEELLEEFHDARFNIDLKSPGGARPLADLIDRTGAHERVLVSSFSPARIRQFRTATGGRVATAASPPEVARFLALPARLAVLRLDPTVCALQVPERRGRLQVLSPRLLARAHRAGLQVHVWTVDEPADIERLVAAGVDGLMTDRTDTLRAVLQRLGRWEEPR